MKDDTRTKVIYNMILSLYLGEEPGLLSMWRSKIKFRNDVWQIANELMAHIENTHSKCTMGCTLITVHLRMGDYSGFIARHKVSLFPEKYHCLSVKNITTFYQPRSGMVKEWVKKFTSPFDKLIQSRPFQTICLNTLTRPP